MPYKKLALKCPVGTRFLRLFKGAFLKSLPNVGDALLKTALTFICFGPVQFYNRFGHKVRKLICKWTDVQLGDDPVAYLLHLAPMSSKRHKRSFTIHLLNAVKACILLTWKQIIPPSMGVWLQKIQEICRVEDFLASSNHKEQFSENCFIGFGYTFSANYPTDLASWFTPPGWWGPWGPIDLGNDRPFFSLYIYQDIGDPTPGGHHIRYLKGT